MKYSLSGSIVKTEVKLPFLCSAALVDTKWLH